MLLLLSFLSVHGAAAASPPPPDDRSGNNAATSADDKICTQLAQDFKDFLGSKQGGSTTSGDSATQTSPVRPPQTRSDFLGCIVS